MLAKYLDEETLANMDLYDQAKLSTVIDTCTNSSTMAEAGRKLFNVSRNQKAAPNDSHRVKQILSKYGLEFKQFR